MQRILIAIEDFNELVFCETILKKVGFNTQSYQTDLALYEAILGFNPDLLIMSAVGNRVNGIAYLAKLKTKNKNLPVILVGQRNRLNVSDRQIVALLEPPLSPRILLEVISTLFDLDEEALVSKYEKSSEYREVKEKSIHIKGDSGERDHFRKFRENKERSNRYKKLATATKLPPFVGVSKNLVQDQVKDFRRGEDSDEIHRIDEERRMFAIELARRAKRGH